MTKLKLQILLDDGVTGEIIRNRYRYVKGDLQEAALQVRCWYQFHWSGKKNAIAMVAQDFKRAEILKNEMDWDETIILLPNSYIGFSNISSYWAHDRFSISRQRKIILYIGSVEKGFDLGLLDMVKSLPEEYVLFINAYSRDNYVDGLDSQYSDLLECGKLIINKIILNEEELDGLVESAHICIAWYSRVPLSYENMYYLGWSSGKLCKYLSYGKPVITPDYLDNYKEMIEENQLGLICNNAATIPLLIVELDDLYSQYSSSIENFYRQNLDYSAMFLPILNLINFHRVR